MHSLVLSECQMIVHLVVYVLAFVYYTNYVVLNETETGGIADNVTVVCL